jgi:hypothetical protein
MENVYSNEKSPKPTTNQKIMYIEEECDQESTTLPFTHPGAFCRGVLT